MLCSQIFLFLPIFLLVWWSPISRSLRGMLPKTNLDVWLEVNRSDDPADRDHPIFEKFRNAEDPDHFANLLYVPEASTSRATSPTLSASTGSTSLRRRRGAKAFEPSLGAAGGDLKRITHSNGTSSIGAGTTVQFRASKTPVHSSLRASVSRDFELTITGNSIPRIRQKTGKESNQKEDTIAKMALHSGKTLNGTLAQTLQITTGRGKLLTVDLSEEPEAVEKTLIDLAGKIA